MEGRGHSRAPALDLRDLRPFEAPLLVTGSDERKMQLPAVLKVQAAFGAVMIALLIVGIIAYRSVSASFESAQWARHTNEVLEHLANLRLGTENIENEYRDFALSGADASLQWSRTNASLADGEQRVLRALTADNPRQQRRLSTISDLLQRMAQRGDTIV